MKTQLRLEFSDALVGGTHLPARVRAIGLRRWPAFEGRFRVDLDAGHCLVPATALRHAGIEEEGHLRQHGPFAVAWISFLGQEFETRILFGPDEAEPVLGAIALEEAGFVVDLEHQTIERHRRARKIVVPVELRRELAECFNPPLMRRTGRR